MPAYIQTKAIGFHFQQVVHDFVHVKYVQYVAKVHPDCFSLLSAKRSYFSGNHTIDTTKIISTISQ